MTHDRLDDALSSLGAREWRAPTLDAITKERTMRTPHKRSPTKLAIGAGLALLAASAVGAATWYAGVFRGVIRDQDGNELDVELQQVEPGVFEGQTADGQRVKFVTQDAAAQPGAAELALPADSAAAQQWQEKKKD